MPPRPKAPSAKAASAKPKAKEVSKLAVPVENAGKVPDAKSTALMVHGAGGSASSSGGDVGIAPYSSNAEAAVDNIVCVRCEALTTLADSQKYGKNPFVRSCNFCCSAYRCKGNLISKEKRESKHNKSAMEEYFTKLAPEQQTQWYRKQRTERESCVVKGGHRKLDKTIVVELAETHVAKRGRRAFNDLVPFSDFFFKNRMLGKSKECIETLWKGMLLNQDIGRESVMVNGIEEVCLELWGGIHIYADESFGTGVKVTAKQDIANSKQLEDAMLEAQTMFNAGIHNSRLAMAPILEPNLPPEELLDIQVSGVSQADIPQAKQFEARPAGSSTLTDACRHQLQSSEEIDRNLELELTAAAGAAGAKKAAGKAKASQDEDSRAVRTMIINVSGAIDRHHQTLIDKLTMLTGDIETVTESAQAVDPELRDSIDADFTKAMTETAEFQKELGDSLLVKKRSLNEDSGWTLEKLKEQKALIATIGLTFTAEGSVYQTCRALVATHKKTVERAVKNAVKRQKTPGAVVSGSGWAPRWSGMRGLLTLEAYEIDGDAIHDDDALSPEILTCDLLKRLPELIKKSGYYVQQVKFLGDHMSKNDVTLQAVTITNKLITQNLKGAVADCDSPMVLKVPPDASKAPHKKSWGKNLGFQIYKYRNHEFAGITQLCLGECFLVLSGSLVMGGVPFGTLDGDFKSQLTALHSMTKENLGEVLTWNFVVDAEMEGYLPKIVCIPPGMLFMLVAEDAVVVQWRWGAVSEDSIATVLEMTQALLTAYPNLKEASEVYKPFLSWLESQ
jgi:hypothetical protein